MDHPAHGQSTICIWGTGNFHAGICIMGNFYGLLFLIVIVGRCMIAWRDSFLYCVFMKFLCYLLVFLICKYVPPLINYFI